MAAKTEKKNMIQQDLTKGSILKTILLFSLPLMAGNLLQQFYNLADTFIVGRYLGSEALAAVGSAFSFMAFVTSVLLGLSMGSGAVFSIRFGERNFQRLRCGIFVSFLFIGGLSVILNIVIFRLIDPILLFMNVPADVYPLMREYLLIVFFGMSGVFLYNYFASLLRAMGNSLLPLMFLAVSVVLNIVLDLVLVLVIPMGIAGAAWATAVSQLLSGISLFIYTVKAYPELIPQKEERRFQKDVIWEIAQMSVLTSAQQSIMQFGILMVQGLVNSFGSAVMAAFAAAVKIDAFAYMPLQDFGNAFSTFIAQNFGAGKKERIKGGIKHTLFMVTAFGLLTSALIFVFAPSLMQLFVQSGETLAEMEAAAEIIGIGTDYLRIEGAFYIGIGYLFMLYGYYRAVKRPGVSVVLTVISLGTRVALAYILSATALSVNGIWLSVPIGWALADFYGAGYYLWLERRRR